MRKEDCGVLGLGLGQDGNLDGLGGSHEAFAGVERALSTGNTLRGRGGSGGDGRTLGEEVLKEGLCDRGDVTRHAPVAALVNAGVDDLLVLVDFDVSAGRVITLKVEGTFEGENLVGLREIETIGDVNTARIVSEQRQGCVADVEVVKHRVSECCRHSYFDLMNAL